MGPYPPPAGAPPPQPPPGYPPYQPPQVPPPQPMPLYGPPAANDGKAIASLVLGILSLVCCFGALAGIPAIILGALSKRDIARSGGAIGGEGMAITGIVTGVLSTLGTIAYIIFYVAVIGAAVATAPTSYSPPPYTPPYAYTTPTATATTPPVGLKPMPYSGSVHVVDVKSSGGTLRTQLALELASAKGASDKLLVITAARTCPACDEVFSAFSDYDLQDAMRKVRVVRVDVDQFPTELSGLGMDKPGLPWFFRFDDQMKLVDAISADEWDDNEAENIMPVLKAFVAGTYKHRATAPADAGVKKKPVSETL